MCDAPQTARTAAEQWGVIRVLLVDDSALIRRLISTALQEAEDIEIIGKARDGVEAVELVDQLEPDVVTLDIEMPRLDGLGALAQIRAKRPRLPVIMFSTLTEKGATATLEALSRGASDYVTKPSNTGSIAEGLASVREQLVPRIRALAGVRRITAAPVAKAAPPARPAIARPTAGVPQVLLVGSSTGGPDALATVLADLPADFPLPVLVVQHMPPVFTTMLAQRLDKICALTVREASDGDAVRVGEVLIAPGDFHLKVTGRAGGVRVRLDQSPPENFCRPAVDALFRSASEVYGGKAIATVLTGMGHDGLEGVKLLGALGAPVIVQDEATSVVWGMPGAIATAGLADEVLPLQQVSSRLVTAAGPHRPALR